MKTALVEMFQYNKWANLTLLEVCRSLSPAQLDAPVPGISGGDFPAPTVRVLLQHIVGAQQAFVLRTMGRQHEGELERESPWPGFAVLVELASRSSDELIAIAEELEEDTDVVLPYLGKRYRYPKRFFLVHALEHGVEHRDQIKLTLGTLGVETPNLDGWAYGAAAGYGQEV